MSQVIILGTQDLSANVYGSFDASGGYWKVKQSGSTSLRTSARKDSPEGAYISFPVVFASEALASAFLAYCYPYSPDSPDFDEEAGADIPLYIRTADWCYHVWGVVVKPAPVSKETMDYIQYSYTVICYLYSPYSRVASPVIWSASNDALPAAKSTANTTGHVENTYDYIDISCRWAGSRVSNLKFYIGSAYSAICTQALTYEDWEYRPKENTLLETYEDDFPDSISRFNADTTRTGTPTYVTGGIRLAGASTRVSAYYRLSGPNRTKKPVKMTASLSGTYLLVQVSSDAVNWTTVLTSRDFVSGSHEYVLEGTEYMKDVYVRFYQNTATTSVYSYISYLKFEAERWIEEGYPTIAAGATSTVQLTGTGTVNVEGKFYPERLFI